MKMYGYIFAYSCQEAKKQKETFERMSVPGKYIFVDEKSMNKEERLNLKRMEKKLQEGDLVYIKSLNGLGSSYSEILEHWRILTQNHKADVAVLDKPLLDTRRGKEIMSAFVAEVVAETLSFVVENEHEKNSRRQKESYLAAKERGTRYGRPCSPLPDNFTSVVQNWKNGEITGVEAAKECGMPLSSFRYRAIKYKDE